MKLRARAGLREPFRERGDLRLERSNSRLYTKGSIRKESQASSAPKRLLCTFVQEQKYEKKLFFLLFGAKKKQKAFQGRKLANPPGFYNLWCLTAFTPLPCCSPNTPRLRRVY